MTVPQEQILRILLYSLCLGAVLGAFYDVFRILRLMFKAGSGKSSGFKSFKLASATVIFIEDIVYFFVCSCVFCIFIFYVNSGRFRSVALIGAIVGFFAYYYSVGRLVMLFSDLVIGFIKKLIKTVLYYTVRPVFILLKKVLELTFLRWFRAFRTVVLLKYYLKCAERGFGVMIIRGKRNEKSYKHIRQGSGSGLYSFLRGNDHKNAV